MTIHTIEPERATLHGSFSRGYPPVLTIEPGDTVHFRTLDSGWHLVPFVTNEASVMALEAMLDLMCEQFHLPRPQALALASLIVDLRITQIVNGGMRGAHAFLPHNVIR